MCSVAIKCGPWRRHLYGTDFAPQANSPALARECIFPIAPVDRGRASATTLGSPRWRPGRERRERQRATGLGR